MDYRLTLKDFSESALRAELRRRRQLHRRPYRPIKHCDECVHFVPHRGAEDIPDDYNPCAKGHDMTFRAPSQEHPHDMEWGHYRTGCKDRKKRTND